MKILASTAALAALALAASADAQVVAPQSLGAGVSTGLSGQVGTAPAVPTSPGTIGAAPVYTGPANAPSLGASAQGQVNTAPPGAIKDGRTLSTGTAVDTSARAPDISGRPVLAGGMNIQDMGGMALGRVVSVTKSAGGQVSGIVIQTKDGVRRTMPADSLDGLTVKGGVAVTSQSEAQLVALPAVR